MAREGFRLYRWQGYRCYKYKENNFSGYRFYLYKGEGLDKM